MMNKKFLLLILLATSILLLGSTYPNHTHFDVKKEINYNRSQTDSLQKVSLRNDNKNVLYFNLDQNFPNPFNPTTTIWYEIAKEGFVKLSVYNVLGKEISNLVNEVQSPGKYEVKFDGRNLSSGIYFYQLNAGNYSATKKLMLMK
jgi:hypothetical protein